MPTNIAYQAIGELASVIPVFPLPGALLLPRGQMPLNIFEPRYLAMIDDALKGARLIGMIQPNPQALGGARPPLHSVGCVGRITQFGETGDGRYLVSLTGICRFRVIEEVSVLTPYRQAHVDYAPFADDLVPRKGEDAVDRAALLAALRAFSDATDVAIDWESVETAPNEALVNALAMMSPYGTMEKQALLEAADLKARADMLVAITEFELARRAQDDKPTVQ